MHTESEMKAAILALYHRIVQLQLDVEMAMARVPHVLATDGLDAMVDGGFLCREIGNIADTIRKSVESREAIYGRALAMRASAAALNGDDVKLIGEFATASPDVKVKPKLPANDSPEYHELMRWIGLTDEQIQRGLVRPSFTAIQEILTDRAARGLKNPPGISVTFTEAGVVFRRKKGSKLHGSENEF